jgi:hypothetical protein
MAIEFFQSPKNGACHMFLENPWQGLSKKVVTNKPSMLAKKIGCHNYHKGGNRIFFFAIQHTPAIKWWLKFFNCLKKHGRDDIYFFKNDGDFFQLPHKGGVSYVFGKPSTTLWSPMLWKLIFFGCCKIGN